MIVTIFRSRLREEHLAEYEQASARVEALAAEQPGFISIKGYVAEDGERIAIAKFADWDSHNAWRNHPQHREAQALGREKFYSEFSVDVAEVVRDYDFQNA